MMHTIAIALVLGAVLGAAGPAQQPQKAKEPPPFQVVLRGAAQVRGADVRIGDLADIAPAGEQALLLSQARFGPAPAPGYTRAVTRGEILQALVLAGHPADRFAFRGAAEVLVQAVVVELPAQEIAETADAVLRSVLDAEGAGDVEAELTTRLRHLQAPPGRESRELKARVRDGRTRAASAIVDVEIWVDGERHKMLPVQFRLSRFHQVLKVTGSIRTGTPLGPENLTLSRERAGETSGLYVGSFQDAAGKVARRNLHNGQLLTISDLADPALIRKGELVTVVSTRGRVRVTAKAIANHDAAQGEMVTLTNFQSRAQITGVAAAPGTVVVPAGN